MPCRKVSLINKRSKPSEERMRKFQEFINAALKRNKYTYTNN